ncbi:MAG: hypothetical protein H8K09_10735 [Nitrospira sp.]|nr:hypothetical protein [Nitrospira sp.]
MPIVERFFTQVQAEGDDSRSLPKPLQQYYSHSAIVVLGDPGSGKTTIFRQSAATEPNAVFVPIRDFLALREDQWRGKILYLDGLDEQRTKTEDGRGVLDRVRRKLDDLNRPQYRLSCRAADWYGKIEAERLRAVSSDGKVVVLSLEPLSDEDIISIAGGELRDPAEFLVQAQRRGIDTLLRNPQTLQLIIAEVRSGVWPATRAELFQQACARLLQERNDEHVYGNVESLPIVKLLNAAGYLCAVHLCGGTKGFAILTEDADGDYPHILNLGEDRDALVSAIRRRAFRTDGHGRFTPVHRTIAEYLAAQFIVARLRAGLPLKRILSLLTGYDGGTLAELRGIYAWLACLYEDHASTLIHRDPLGVILYGDVSVLSTSSKQMLIDSLRALAISNPGFRTENWSDEPFGGLASKDMVPIFESILAEKTEPPQLLTCILDAIEYGPPLPELGSALLKIVRDNTSGEGIRAAALSALQRISPNDHLVLRKLLDEIHKGQVLDQNHRLRGQVLCALYPGVIGPREIGQYLVEQVEHHINSYTMFIAYDLVRLTKSEDLPLLLSAVDASKLVDRTSRLNWRRFFGNLILQILRYQGETTPASELYAWFGRVLDEYGHPVADKDELESIQDWLRSHPAVVQQLFLYWLSISELKNPRHELHGFWQHLFNIAPPVGFHKWLLQQLETELEPGRAELIFRTSVHGRTYLQREDAPTLDEFFEFVIRNPAFGEQLRSELCWDIPPWRREDAERRLMREQKDETQRAIRIKQLTEQIEGIRSAASVGPLVHLAKVYFGLFYDVARESPPSNRLTTFTNPEIAAATLEGFLATLQLPDLPSPQMIGELESNGREYSIGFPVLAGLDVLAGKSLFDILALAKTTLQSGLVFHYANLTERSREWVNLLIESMPEISASALVSYWRPHLARNLQHIPGLYDLAHEERMKGVARLVSLTLLKEFPNCLEDNLKLLLRAATRNSDPTEFVTLSDEILNGPTLLSDENKTLWCAATFILDPERVKARLAAQISGREEQAARLLGFISPSLGIATEVQYCLSSVALASVIQMTGPIFQPPDLAQSGWLGLHSRGEAASSVRSLIYRLGNDLSSQASEALHRLHDSPTLAPWRIEIAHVLATQGRQRRELAFKYPSVTQVIETLNKGRPANAADLQALVVSQLEVLREELRNGPTDGWKAMWNVDGYGRPTGPRPENDCRDRLLDHLRLQLLQVGVAAEPEGHYAEDKRADIKAIAGPLNLPVEVKRHYHPDLWTAPRDQLKRLYSRDPGTAGRGIYVVLWFGNKVASCPTSPSGTPAPQTPRDLEVALLQTLTHFERDLILVVVIDCAPTEA